MIGNSFKKIAGLSLWTLVPALVATNYAQGLKRALGALSTGSGSRHARIPNVADSLAYIDSVFADYARYAGRARENWDGATVLEVGPGDNLGVALEFLVHGAAHVACLDKYDSARDAVRQRAIYEALRARLPPPQREVFDRALSLRGDGVPDGATLRCIRGVGIEESLAVLAPCSFDVIVSRAVMEHVRDARAAFVAMDALLKPGGMMLHKIDFRDHGLFSAHGWHPLTFLTLPAFLYRHVAGVSGRPNRTLLPDCRRWLNELGYDAEFHVTHVLGGMGDLIPYARVADAGKYFTSEGMALLNGIRPRLADSFRSLPDVDLMTTGVFVAARKPAGSAVTS